MSVNYDADVNAIGGGMGGMGGMGGGAWPLWLLVFLGLGKDGGGLLGGGGNAGAGVLAGETQAKLDCLSQGQNTLANQITNGQQAERFNSLSQQINTQGDINRTAIGIVGDRVNSVQAQLAECCCEIRTGQLGLANDIAMQTNQLNVVANSNTQKLLDAINAQNISILEGDNSRLREQLNRSEIIAAVQAQCGPKPECNGGNGVDINILNLARAMANGGFNPGPGNNVA